MLNWIRACRDDCFIEITSFSSWRHWIRLHRWEGHKHCHTQYLIAPFIPFHTISYHFILFHIISYHFIPFHTISYCQTDLQGAGTFRCKPCQEKTTGYDTRRLGKFEVCSSCARMGTWPTKSAAPTAYMPCTLPGNLSSRKSCMSLEHSWASNYPATPELLHWQDRQKRENCNSQSGFKWCLAVSPWWNANSCGRMCWVGVRILERCF